MNKDKEIRLHEIMKGVIKAKTEVLAEFEKVCPTDKSFDRVRKEVHDIFDEMIEHVKFHI